MNIYIIGDILHRTAVENLIARSGFNVITRLARATEPPKFTRGPMGILRLASSRTVQEIFASELAELRGGNMEGVAGILFGAPAPQSPTTRFSLATELASKYGRIPMSAIESPSTQSEVRIYYPQCVEIIVSHKEFNETEAALRAFLNRCKST